MIKTIKIKTLTNEIFEKLGLVWHTDLDDTPYISDEIISLTENEVENYHKASNELYDMFIKTGEYIIENNLLDELNIPFNLQELVKKSWEDDVHWHLYGRFDLAGGIDGQPIKLIEFNADTPTSLLETALIQWAILKHNNLDDDSQFNNIYESLKLNFKRLTTLDENIDSFEENYDGWKILFSSVKDNLEDEQTTKFLQSSASEAGFITEFAYIDEVDFSSEDGIFYNGINYEYWFKLIPWETIAIEESELTYILTDIVNNQKAIILNPAYTLMFQSKAFMKFLWDLYPNHQLLLETSFEPLKNISYVEKKTFSREGANTKIFDKDNNLIEEVEGEYENFKSIFQKYVEFPEKDGKKYQAGVFFAYEACGIAFRKGGLILDNYSKFVGHIIK